MSRAEHLNIGLTLGMSAKETMLFEPAIVFELWELHVKRNSLSDSEGN